MANLITQKQKHIIKIVEDAVAAQHALLKHGFREKTRRQEYVHARYVAWYILRNRFRFSFPLIAQVYGFEHSSVLQGVKRMKEIQLDEEAEWIINASFPHIHRTNSSSSIL